MDFIDPGKRFLKAFSEAGVGSVLGDGFASEQATW
jgi:hypothetical protein